MQAGAVFHRIVVQVDGRGHLCPMCPHQRATLAHPCVETTGQAYTFAGSGGAEAGSETLALTLLWVEVMMNSSRSRPAPSHARGPALHLHDGAGAPRSRSRGDGGRVVRDGRTGSSADPDARTLDVGPYGMREFAYSRSRELDELRATKFASHKPALLAALAQALEPQAVDGELAIDVAVHVGPLLEATCGRVTMSLRDGPSMAHLLHDAEHALRALPRVTAQREPGRASIALTLLRGPLDVHASVLANERPLHFVINENEGKVVLRVAFDGSRTPAASVERLVTRYVRSLHLALLDGQLVMGAGPLRPSKRARWA